MSQPHLFTIDFFGNIRDHPDEIPLLNSAMDCHQQSLHTRSTQSCLGKIKPHMLQQVLSHGSLSDSENFHGEGQIRVSEEIKTLDLFPQHPLGFQSGGKQDNSQSAVLDTRIEISEGITTNLSQSVSYSEESTEGAKKSHAVPTYNSNLPMAKRLSLQRFLERRKDRLSRVVPYASPSK